MHDLQGKMESLKELLEYDLISYGGYRIKVYTLLLALLIILISRAITWIIKKALFRNQNKKDIDIGNLHALYQIINYVIWVLALGLVLETFGVKLTVLIAGSAALLVGVGLGLQQTFNDIISGIILLSERSIKIGDILEIDGDIVKIQTIGLRTSKGLNRDEISIIIPNSLITTNKVINWSHQSKQTRFRISVGVAYGSDIDLVLKVLEESALEHVDISDKKSIEARLIDFGNSSLDFQILFYSRNIFGIERVKSDVRKIISRKFMENNISIPFPQLDLHVKSDERN